MNCCMLNSSLDFIPQSRKRFRGQEFRNHNESIAPEALELPGPEPLAPAAALFSQLQPSTMQIPATIQDGMSNPGVPERLGASQQTEHGAEIIHPRARIGPRP